MSAEAKQADRRLSRAEFLELGRLSARYAWAFPLLVILGVLSSFAEGLGISLVVLFLYTAMGQAADAAAIGGALGRLFSEITSYVPNATLLAPLILVMILARAAFSTCYAMLSASIQQRLGQDIRDRLHQQYLDVEYNYVRQREEGEMLNVLSTQSWAVSTAYFCLSRILISGTALIVMTAFMLTVSWPLTLLAAIGAGALMVSLTLVSKPARRLGRRSVEANREVAARMLQTLQGMRAIRAFGQQRHHQEAFEQASAEARRVAVKTEHMVALLNPVAEISYLLLLAAILVLANAIAVPFAATLAVVALLYRLQIPLRNLQGALLGLAQIEAPLSVVTDVLRRADKRYPSAGAHPFDTLRGAIEFRAIDFSYGDGPKVLDRVSFRIPAGKTTALVGASGAGKTTIVNLLLRLDTPTGGEIMVDDRPLEDLRQADWLERLAVAGQDIELMHSSIGENIMVARAGAPLEAVREAARLAGILDVIESFPYGFDEWVGPQGANLSGGQRQRLGLARAFLRDPQILILDEATSALDIRLEDTVRESLRSQFHGRTIVMITHRLASVLSADHIVCIENGRIVDAGSPAELLAKPRNVLRELLENEAPAEDIPPASAAL